MKWRGLVLGERTISDILVRERNNFDLLRLIAASMVILGHSFAIAPREGAMDPVLKWIHFDYSGGVAVTVFFFLSGLLVSESILKHGNPFSFIVARCTRIFPGLLVCLWLSVVVLGSIFTTSSILDYWGRAETTSYFYNNLGLTNLQWRIPTVFDGCRHGLNGSLWTLPLEVRLYLVVAVIGYAVGAGNRVKYFVLTGLLALWAIWRPDTIPYFLRNSENIRPIAAFGTGMAFSSFKQHIRLSFAAWIAMFATFLVLPEGSTRHIFFYAAMFYGGLLLFSPSWVNRLRLPGDYSYGIYIYGFPIQQMYAAIFPGTGPYSNFAYSLITTLAMAALSWHCVEKPALSWPARLRDTSVSWSKRIPLKPIMFLVGLAIVPWLIGQTIPPAIPLLSEPETNSTSEGDFYIVTFGPNPVKQGCVFNAQPNGQAAIWVQASRPLKAEAMLFLGDQQLTSSVSGNVITAFVPSTIYATVGVMKLQIRERIGRDTRISKPVDFIVLE